MFRGLLAPAACGAALILGLLLASPERLQYREDVAPRGAGEQLLQRLDADFRRGTYPYISGDEASYFAMAERPFGDDYLVRRSPYCFRVLEPLLAHGLKGLGLDTATAFLVIGAVGLFAAGLAVASVLRGTGCSAGSAATGGALFMLTPAALVTLATPHVIDAGSWALMFWSWLQWRRGRPVASALLLVAAVLWRETAALLLLCMVFSTVRSARPKRDLALVALPVVAAILLTHLLIQPVQSFPIGLVVERVLDVRRAEFGDWDSAQRLLLEYTVHGLGILSLALVVRSPWRGRTPNDLAPLLLLPAAALLTLAAFNVSRLLVPAVLGVVVLAVAAIDRDPPGVRALSLSIVVAVTVALDFAYIRGGSSVSLVVLIAAALALTAALGRRIGARDEVRA